MNNFRNGDSKRDTHSRRDSSSPKSSSKHSTSSSSNRAQDNNGTTEGSRSKVQLAEDLKSKELVYEAKMKIQERIKELGLPIHQPSSSSSKAGGGSGEKFKETILRPEEAKAFTQLHMEKMERLNEVKILDKISTNLYFLIFSIN